MTNEVKDEAPRPTSGRWAKMFDWIEAQLGGRIVRHERQPRWRPAFFLELDRDGEIVPLYFRGARSELPNGPEALQYEMKVLQILEAEGIPVPHVYGFCTDPPGIVMERSPGRANLATAKSEEERRSVLDHYMEILARMHAIDVARFAPLGIEPPRGAEALGLGDLASWENRYRAAKSRPEPIIEFVLGWLKRNVPEGRERVCFLAADSGQFLFDEGRVTALVDLELACLGDPAADLGGMRGRDLSEPLGDLSPAFARYFEITGEEIPSSVIDHHTVRFNLNTPLAISALVADPTRAADLVQYLGWYWVWSRACLEVIAHGMQLPLEPITLPEPTFSRHSLDHDALTGRLKPTEPAANGDESFSSYESGAAYRLAEYLRRAERYGPALERDAIDEVAALVGAPITDWREADQKLENFVLGADPSRDAELVALLHRRCLREEALLKPVLRELEDVRIQHITR